MADHRAASIDQASEIFTTDARIIGDSRKKKRKEEEDLSALPVHLFKDA